MSYSEQLNEIIEALGGEPLPTAVGLWTMQLDRIIELLDGGLPGGASWGSITGNIEEQTDLMTTINARALPSVTSSDNGKFLRVVNGAWAASTIPNASGVTF